MSKPELTVDVRAPTRPPRPPLRYRMSIDGKWVDGPSEETLEGADPITGRIWALLPRANESDVAYAVAAARLVFDEGRSGRTAATERARPKRRRGDLIEERCGHTRAPPQ